MKRLILILTLWCFASISQAQFYAYPAFTDYSTQGTGSWNEAIVSASTPYYFSQGGEWRGVEYEVRGLIGQAESYFTKTLSRVDWEWSTGPSWLTHPCVQYGCSLHICLNSYENQTPAIAWCVQQYGSVVPGQPNKLIGSTNGFAPHNFRHYGGRTWRWTLNYSINGSGWIGQPVTDFSIKTWYH